MIKSFTLSSLGEGEVSRPAADRVVEGDPISTTWYFEKERATAGVWSCTTGSLRMIRDEKTWEMFTIIEGEVEIEEDGGECRRYLSGDTIIIPPNFIGVWRTIKDVRKIFITL